MSNALLWLLHSNILDMLQGLIGLVALGIVYATIIRTRNSLRHCCGFLFAALAVYVVTKLLRLLSPLLLFSPTVFGLILAILNFFFVSFFLFGMLKMLHIVQCLRKERKRKGNRKGKR